MIQDEDVPPAVPDGPARSMARAATAVLGDAAADCAPGDDAALLQHLDVPARVLVCVQARVVVPAVVLVIVMPNIMRRIRTRLPTYLSTGFGALVDIYDSPWDQADVPVRTFAALAAPAFSSE